MECRIFLQSLTPLIGTANSGKRYQKGLAVTLFRHLEWLAAAEQNERGNRSENNLAGGKP
jgi:hypothetical protein